MANIQSIGATESEKTESWDTPAIDYFERLVKGSNRVISYFSQLHKLCYFSFTLEAAYSSRGNLQRSFQIHATREISHSWRRII